MSSEPIISLKNTIIEDPSFNVPKGEIFGFLGPNDAGKTTTIRMIAGLMSISNYRKECGTKVF
jgi:ABC-2 type transport system ATP-binding protein